MSTERRVVVTGLGATTPLGGTITSTVLTLFVIPTVYEILDDWREKLGARFRRGRAAHGEVVHGSPPPLPSTTPPRPPAPEPAPEPWTGADGAGPGATRGP